MKPVLGGCAGIVGNSVTQYIDKNTTSKPERQTVKDGLYIYNNSNKTEVDQKTFVETINTLKNSKTASPALRELFKAPVGIFGSSNSIAHEAEHYATVAERLIMVKALHKADGKPTDYFYSPISNDDMYKKLIESYNDKLTSQNIGQNKFSEALVKLGRAQRCLDPVMFNHRCALLRYDFIQEYKGIASPVDKQVIENFVSDFEAVVKMSSHNTLSRATTWDKLYNECCVKMKPIVQLMLLPAVLLNHKNSIGDGIGEKHTLQYKVLELLKKTIAESKDADVLKLLQTFNNTWKETEVITHNGIVEFIKTLAPYDSLTIPARNIGLIKYTMLGMLNGNADSCDTVITILTDRCNTLHKNGANDEEVVRNMKQVLDILNMQQVKYAKAVQDRVQDKLNLLAAKITHSCSSELKKLGGECLNIYVSEIKLITLWEIA